MDIETHQRMGSAPEPIQAPPKTPGVTKVDSAPDAGQREEVLGALARDQVQSFYFCHAKKFSGGGLELFQLVRDMAMRSLEPVGNVAQAELKEAARYRWMLDNPEEAAELINSWICRDDPDLCREEFDAEIDWRSAAPHLKFTDPKTGRRETAAELVYRHYEGSHPVAAPQDGESTQAKSSHSPEREGHGPVVAAPAEIVLLASEYAQLVRDARRYEGLRDKMKSLRSGSGIHASTRYFIDVHSDLSFQEAVDVMMGSLMVKNESAAKATLDAATNHREES